MSEQFQKFNRKLVETKKKIDNSIDLTGKTQRKFRGCRGHGRMTRLKES
jgi:hypothetical protein